MGTCRFVAYLGPALRLGRLVSAPEHSLVELGSGSSVKTRLLLDEGEGQGYSMHYIPIDISESMLRDSAKSLVASYPRLCIDALVTEYFQGLGMIPSTKRRVVLFLGSNLGNFSPEDQATLFERPASTLLGPGISCFWVWSSPQKSLSRLTTMRPG